MKTVLRMTLLRSAAKVLGNSQRRSSRAQLLRTALEAEWAQEGSSHWLPEACLGGGVLEDAADLEDLIGQRWRRIQQVGGSAATSHDIRRVVFQQGGYGGF